MKRSGSNVKVKPKKNPAKKYKRRPSFDIARSFVEMNFAILLAPEMTEKEAKKAVREERKLARKEQRNRHRLRNAIIIGFSLIALCVGTAAIWWAMSITPVDINDEAERGFTVDDGASVSQIADALQKNGFIKSALAFRIYAKINKTTIQAGNHTLSRNYSMPEIADKLSKAQVSEKYVKILPEKTLKEIQEEWVEDYGFTEEQVKAAFEADYASSVLEGRPEGATLEGYIFPDTYRIYSTDGPQAVVEKALAEFELVADQNDLRTKFANQGLTFYQGVTLASIVIKETANEADQKVVAGVFYNRINNGISLGSDVTFHYAYAQGLCDVNTPACDSVYNTRMHSGLPPGPIANVTKSALLAVAEPESTDYFYFVAGDGADKGKTFFAKTYDEHAANIAEHCHELCQ